MRVVHVGYFAVPGSPYRLASICFSQSVFYKRIASAFRAKSAFRSVTGYEYGVIAQWPQFLSDAVEQLLVVATGKVCTTYAAGKQHVPDKSALLWRVMKHYVSRCMPRAVQYIQRTVAYLYCAAILQPAGRLKR